MKCFQFYLFALCAVFCNFSFAVDATVPLTPVQESSVGEHCSSYLVPAHVPTFEEKEIISHVVQDLKIEESVLAFTNPNPALGLQSAKTPDLVWFAEPDLHSSTQFLLNDVHSADWITGVANEAFRLTQEAFKQYPINLHASIVNPLGRPRIRVGMYMSQDTNAVAPEGPVEPLESAQPERPTLAVYTISSEVSADAEKNTLDLLRINLMFYKHLRDLLLQKKP